MEIKINVLSLLPTQDEFILFFSAFCLVCTAILFIGEIIFWLQADWPKRGKVKENLKIYTASMLHFIRNFHPIALV